MYDEAGDQEELDLGQPSEDQLEGGGAGVRHEGKGNSGTAGRQKRSHDLLEPGKRFNVRHMAAPRQAVKRGSHQAGGGVGGLDGDGIVLPV